MFTPAVTGRDPDKLRIRQGHAFAVLFLHPIQKPLQKVAVIQAHHIVIAHPGGRDHKIVLPCRCAGHILCNDGGARRQDRIPLGVRLQLIGARLQILQRGTLHEQRADVV